MVNLIAATALGIHKGSLAPTIGKLRPVFWDSDTAAILTSVVFGSAIDACVLEQKLVQR